MQYLWLLEFFLLLSNLPLRCFVWLIPGDLNDYEDTWRMINGLDVMPGQYPSYVNIKFKLRPACCGALISDYQVLTAAHCVMLKNPRRYQVVPTHLGQNHDLPHPKMRNGSRICVDKATDLAILQLDRPMPMDQYSHWVELDTDSKREKSDTIFILVAGGKINHTHLSERIQETFMQDTECPSIVPEYKLNPICLVGDNTHRSCEGDSGAPIYRLIDGKIKLAAVLTSGKQSSCAIEKDLDITYAASIAKNMDSIEILLKNCDRNSRAS